MRSKKKLIAIILCLAMVLTIAPMTMFASAADPIEIGSLAELKKIGTDEAYPLDGNYKLTADIKVYSVDEKVGDLLAVDANQQTAGDAIKYKPTPATYVQTSDTEIQSGKTYYTYAGDGYTVVDTPDVASIATYYEVATYNYSKVTYADYLKLGDTDKTAVQAALGSPTSDGEKSFTMIGDFTGTFDGNDKTIDGIVVTCSGDQMGLFKSNSGTIKNLTLGDKVYINANVGNVSAFTAGAVTSVNSGTLDGITSNANLIVTSKFVYGYSAYVGGVVGYNKKDVSNSSFGGSILLKCASDTFTANSLSTVNTVGSFNVGGIAGSTVDAVTDCTYVAATASMRSELIGRSNFYMYTITGKSKVGTDMAASVTDKSVATKDAVSPYDSEAGATVTKGDFDSADVQLVSVTHSNGDKTYYIRQKTCSHTNAQLTNAVPSTCSEKGDKAYYYCPDCKKYFDGDAAPTITSGFIAKDSWVDQLELDPTKHDLESITAKAADCENVGYSQDCVHCKDCDKYFADEASATANTPLAESPVLNALNHSFTNYVYDNNATANADGTQTAKCDRCDAKDTKTAPGTRLPSVAAKSSSGYTFKTVNSTKHIVVSTTNKNGVSVSSFISGLETLPSGYTYGVKKASGEDVTGNVGTGYKVAVYKDGTMVTGSQVTIAILGDVNGDGEIAASDYMRIKNHVLAKNKKKSSSNLITDSAKNIAADANLNGDITASDYMRIKNIILNKIK